MASKPKRKQKRNDTCLYCNQDQSEDPVGPDTEKLSWLCCDVCNQWTHLNCFEAATSTVGSVTPELFTFISRDENIIKQWYFSCSKCSGTHQSIPDQLETQSLMRWQHLVDLGVNPSFITQGDPPSSMVTAAATMGPTPSTSTTSVKTTEAPPAGFGIVPPTVTVSNIVTPIMPSASTSTASASASGPTPVSSTPTGDLTAMLKFFMEREASERQEREQERKDTQAMFMRLLENRDEKYKDLEKTRTEELKQMEKARLEQEKTLKEQQLRFEMERLEKEQDMERKRLEQEAELEKRRIQKEEDMKAEQMKMEERRDDHLTHLFGQLQTGENIPTPSSDRQRIGLKLPFVKIPNFNGDVLKWMEFWDMFSATVHDNPDLSPVQKLSHLKASLEGPARESISQLAMVNDNYKVAVDLLKKRYGNMEIIEEKLFEKLQNLPTSSMRLEDLRHTFHTVEQSLEQLKNLDDNFGSGSCEGHFLVNMVKKKFPPKIVIEIEKEQTKSWGLKDLMSKLEQVISIYQREADLKAEVYGHKAITGSSPRFSQPISRGNFSPGSTFKGNYSSKPRSSADALMASEGQKNSKDGKNRKNSPPLSTYQRTKDSEQNRKLRYPCVFCDGDHFPDDCDKYTTVMARKNQLYIAKRCYMCLRSDHTWKDCSSPWKTRPCKGCQQVGYHHYTLCKDWIRKKTKPGSSPQHMNFTFHQSQSNSADDSSSLSIQKIPSTSSVKKPVSAGNHMATGDMGHLAIRYKSVMQTAKIPVQDPLSKRILHANIFMDSGSNICWMSSDFCQRLGLKQLYKKSISVKTFGTLQQKQIECFATRVDLFTADKQLFPIEVTVIDHLASPISKPALDSNDLEFLKANENRYKLAPETTSQWESEFPVDVIIGQDYYWQLINLGQKSIDLPSGLQLISSKFGYLLGGGNAVSETNPSSHQSISHYVMSEPNEVFSTLTKNSAIDKAEQPSYSLEDFWDLERIGILDSPVENDDERALDGFNKTIKFENGRYHSTWMWKSGDFDLPDNYSLALGRFKSLAKRFLDDPVLYQKYAAIIEEQLQKGIIEKVTGQTETGPRQHYLPHHPVVTPLKETTKVRIVYDASAKARKGANSLNDCLYRGPVILPDLCGLLIRFRTYPIAILADIEKAFLQIGLQTFDRDVTRFLWFRNPENPNLKHPEQDIQIYRFCRVAFGVICSPSILEATVKYHLNQVGTNIALDIADNIYVDNVLVGAQNATDAMQIYSAAKQTFSSASMNLREWTSNSQEFMDQIPENDRAKMNKPTIKVLGLQWYLKSDEIQVAGYNSDKMYAASSKREVLRALAQIFDPLGFFTPITFYGKIFMEKLWSLNKTWDEPLSEDSKQQWNKVADILVEISSVKLPRFLGISPLATDFQLIIFCDASSKAYGAAVYLRYSSAEKFCTHLLFTKSRLAPKIKTKKDENEKLTSLPKLELLGVLIGVRAANFVRRELKLDISQVMICTDSECVLHWLKSMKPVNVFVENRLKEIRKSKDFNFRYVRSAENPADLITRGCTIPDLETNSLWWHGPEWLQLNSDQWPKVNVPDLTPELLEIIEGKTKAENQISLSSREGPAEKNGISAVIDETRFSKFGKLMGATCYVLRFIRMKVWNRVSDATKQKLGFLKDVEIKGILTTKERNLAERLWIYSVQRKFYDRIFYDMQSKKRNFLQMQLGLRLDSNGLLRCHGRLGHAELSYDARFPILLPSSGHFTTLLIEAVHRRLYHGGTSHTLAHLRSQFWIPKGRKTAGNIIRRCLLCKRYHGGPYQLPTMPDLPKERVSQARPFQYVGIDYLGPVYCKNGDTVSKAWICLFTCMAVRAVHLELVLSMDTKSFLECFRRFIARHGKPDRVISDNAPTFKLADRTLDFIWSNVTTNPQALEYFSSQKIEWVYITELAPWQGGFYERLAGVVKKSLRKALGRKYYDWTSLQTILEEIKAVVNTRPLTFVYNELNGGQVVRPSDFIGAPSNQIGIPSTDSDQKDPDYLPDDISSAQKLEVLWRQQQNRVDLFWELWKNEYLLSLRERYQTEHKNPRLGISGSPRLGEIVLVHMDKQSRGSWPLAKVIDLQTGSDGAIRSAKVKLADGSELNRSVKYLYPVEIPIADMDISMKDLKQAKNVTSSSGSGPDVTSSNGSGPNVTPSSGPRSFQRNKISSEPAINTRPSRKAAEIAGQRIRDQLHIQDADFAIATSLTENQISKNGIIFTIVTYKNHGDCDYPKGFSKYRQIKVMV